ncbi:hypothetical protein DES38_10198 [Streptohalobacillus salinus]|uniref:6-hydroxymethylpterin diphosphokinase MptE-like domain-containing protein n=1 Tax=Streptohalobacillus salinus TaxID=621096 RepID=A0A2V3WK19_9BACI|nr:6-hydroxymethylpterin diphosphokinase MptE-like protein [Streptohalobacillus salinus]PXW93018.1 hypothetical protein DES38_10198 [Streptohalobacillus salinus]
MHIDNINYLRENFPRVRKYMLSLPEIERINVEELKAKNDSMTAKIQVGEKKVFLHSSYSPEKEAEQLIHKETQANIDEDSHVIFFGMGYGYAIKAFISKYPSKEYSVIEPNIEVFEKVSEKISFSSLFNTKLKYLFVAEEFSYEEMISKIAQSIGKQVKIIALPTYANLYKAEISQLYDLTKNLIRNKRVTFATNYKFQLNWMENSIKNHRYVLDTPNIVSHVDFEQFRNKPVVIISAGPSLSQDIEHIRYIKDNKLAYLFSVGSAINALVSADILPDAVFSYDPGVKNHQVFEKLIAKGLDSIPLVFGSSVGYRLLDLYKGPKMHFITSQDQVTRYLLGDEILKKELILDSPSIAVMTFQIVNKLEMGPIIFAGQNLGYLYNRRYAEGIDYNFIDSNVQEKEMNNSLNVEDVYGNVIQTNLGFNNMRESLERFASMYNRQYINTTKGGAKIKGIEFKTIEDVIEDDLKKGINKDNWWEGNNKYGVLNYHNKLNKLHDAIDDFKIELNNIINLNVKISNTDDNSALECYFKEIDAVRSKLEKNAFYSFFIVKTIKVQHELMIEKLLKLSKEPNILIRSNLVNNMYNNYLPYVVKASNILESLFLSEIKEND